jgi:Outer membrane protein beta-barrel domain
VNHPATVLKRICRAFMALAVLSFLAAPVYSQRDGVVKNLPKYDQQKVHFGFVLGMNSSTFRTEMVPDFHISDSIYTITPSASAGLNLGIISNFRIGKHFDLRFIPSLSFSQRNLEYFFLYAPGNGATTLKKVESTYLEFPLLIKFKSTRINNYRIYVLAGGKYAIDMVSQAKVVAVDKELIKLQRYDYGYEIGIGFDFYMSYFKFSPEIKMYHGIPNLLVQDGTRFSNPLEALYAKSFIVSLTFE